MYHDIKASLGEPFTVSKQSNHQVPPPSVSPTQWKDKKCTQMKRFRTRQQTECSESALNPLNNN